MPIVVGLVETAAGGVQLAMRQGLDGELVILPVQAGSQLIVNLRESLIELMRTDKGGGSS